MGCKTVSPLIILRRRHLEFEAVGPEGKYAQIGLLFPYPYPENPVKSSVLEMKIKCLIIASFAKIRQEYTSLNARQRPLNRGEFYPIFYPVYCDFCQRKPAIDVGFFGVGKNGAILGVFTQYLSPWEWGLKLNAIVGIIRLDIYKKSKMIIFSLLCQNTQLYW